MIDRATESILQKITAHLVEKILAEHNYYSSHIIVVEHSVPAQDTSGPLILALLSMIASNIPELGPLVSLIGIAGFDEDFAQDTITTHKPDISNVMILRVLITAPKKRRDLQWLLMG